MACRALVGNLGREDGPFNHLHDGLAKWSPTGDFYNDVEAALGKDEIFIPKKDFRLLMEVGFSYSETKEFVERLNIIRGEVLARSARQSYVNALDPESYQKICSLYLNEVNQEFVVGGSPRSLNTPRRIIQVLGGGLVIAADLVGGFTIPDAALSVGAGLAAIGDGLT